MRIYSFSPFGYEGNLVAVEVDIRRGIPAIDIVGLADGAVKESRERMKSAIRNSGFDFPPERVLISLSPADLKKEGAGFDLPVALAVLAEAGRWQEGRTDGEPASDGESRADADKPRLLEKSVLVMGELELSGTLRPVRAVNAAASTARALGISLCVVPAANADEAREASGMKVFGAENLREAFETLFDESRFLESKRRGADEAPANSVEVGGVFFCKAEPGSSFEEVFGQERLVRGLQIAAAGGHNLMAFGPPGCGKTLALQRFPALLPMLTEEEARSVTRIKSIAGLAHAGQGLSRTPPFRQPHMSASLEGMCGGGVLCRPGEISLAHNGVLFLDEAAEFKSGVLQMLRVPMETGSVSLSRAGRTAVYPADFQLLMATNPCPCGNYGSDKKVCLCSGRAIEGYWKKFSAPLLDRIDLRVQVDLPQEGAAGPVCSTADLRVKIARAVKTQRARQKKKNARLNLEEILAFCPLSAAAKGRLEAAVRRYDFSPRAAAACKKIARTIADMEGSAQIEAEHMAEAIDFRRVNGVLQ